MTTKTQREHLKPEAAKTIGAFLLGLTFIAVFTLLAPERLVIPMFLWMARVWVGLLVLAFAVIVLKEVVVPLLGALDAVFTSITGLFGVTRTEEEVSPLGLRIRRIYRGHKMISSEVVGRI